MESWSFPSKNHGEIEGYANPGMEMFKGNPLQALTREICQNSLDAADGDKTVEVEFRKYDMQLSKFPGMYEMERIIHRCIDFWGENANRKTRVFLDNALEVLSENRLRVLRVSDFNTSGLSGAYATGKEITPWVKLVKGNAISTKEGDSAGSYGIGKAAAFVNSAFQTVFYRTMDTDEQEAAQGVARLMSFENPDSEDDDPIRRAVGYYGNPENNMPVEHIRQLDEIYKRNLPGTDLFIPGFTGVTADGKWIIQMICEILDNFLMSVHNGKLIVRIQDKVVDKDSLRYLVAQNEKHAKDAYYFNKILLNINGKVVEDTMDFHGMGHLKLRLLYEGGLNKKILVVRKSGMKISEIPGLPKSVSYTGILELEGYDLNVFFREMENPQHNRWEPNRHPNTELAKKYKNEVEDWVKSKINEHIEEMAGEEIDLDTGDLFSASRAPSVDEFSDKQLEENIVDSVKSIDIALVEKKTSTIKKSGSNGKDREAGKVDAFGRYSAIRSHEGKKGIKPGKPGGEADKDGKDQVKKGTRIVNAKARSIATVDGRYKIILEAASDIENGRVEVISSGENGKGALIHIQNAATATRQLVIRDGKIEIGDMKQGEKIEVSFDIADSKRYALGVKLYGN